MKLHDPVRLLVDLPGQGLTAGAVGAIVQVFDEPEQAFEVEFTDDRGRTVAQIPLTLEKIAPV